MAKESDGLQRSRSVEEILLSPKGLAAIVVVALVLAALAVPAARRYVSARSRTLTDAERTPLELSIVGGERRLRHRTLGFSVAIPEEFDRLPPERVAKINSNPRTAAVAWGDRKSGRALWVELVVASSEPELRALFAGIRGADDKNSKASGKPPFQTVTDEVVWRDGRREGHRHVVRGDEHIHNDAFVEDYEGGRTLMIVLVTTSLHDDSLANLASTFRAR